jgi:hypothetical protein
MIVGVDNSQQRTGINQTAEAHAVGSRDTSSLEIRP